MTCLTASTPNQDDLVEIQRRSCFLCGIEPDQHIRVPIHSSYERHPSWFKIQALISHLPHHEHILWMDSDSMMLKKHFWPSVTCNTFDFALCRDFNGWNAGVMLIKRTPKSFEYLWRILNSYDMFRSTPWHEQTCLMYLAEEIKPRELDKRTYNAYQDDRGSQSVILHLPNKDHDYRLSVMGDELSRLKP